MAKYRLTSPDGTKYEVTAPDDAQQEDVLSYFQKQVGQPKEPDAAGLTDRAIRRTRHTASLGLLDAPFDAAAAGLKALSSGDFSGEYQRQRAITKSALQSPDGLNTADVAADTLGNTAGMAVTAPLTMSKTVGEMGMRGAQAFTNQLTRFMAPKSAGAIAAEQSPEMLKAGAEMTRKQIAGESTRIGTAFGVAGGYGNAPDDASTGEVLQHMTTEGMGGAVIGRALPFASNLYGDYVSGPIRNALAARQLARAQKARGVAGDYDAAGVPQFVPAQGGAATQGTAEGLAPTVFGSAIRNQAKPAIQALEQNIQGDLAGAKMAPEAAGQQAQDFLKNQLQTRTLTSEAANEANPLEAHRLTGIPPHPDYNPAPPRVPPTQPRELPRVSPEQVLDEQAAGVVPVEPRKIESVEGQYREPTLDEIELHPELFKKVEKANKNLADLKRRQAAEEQAIAEQEARFRKEVLEPSGYTDIKRHPELDLIVATAPDGRRITIEPPGRVRSDFPGRKVPPEDAAFATKVGEYVGGRDYLHASLTKSQQAAAEAAAEAHAAQVEAALFRTHELPALAEKRRAQALEKAQAEENATAAVATQKARADAREQGAAGAIQEAEKRTVAAREFEQQRAIDHTAQRQAEAEAEQADRLASAQRDQGRFYQLGQERARGVSYPTELDLAYTQTRNNAPPGLQRNPLGWKDTATRPEEGTHVSNELLRIATEARGGALLPGFKGSIFNESGALKDDVLAHLQEHLGADIAGRLKYFSDRRAKNQTTPDLQGLLDVRTAIRRAAESARTNFPGQPRNVDDAMLTRVGQALDRDIQDFARAAGPDGVRFAEQRHQVDLAYGQYVNDLREPLSKVFGDKVDPAAALRQLINATKTGSEKTDLLKAFFQVVDQKGDRSTAVGWLLNDMTRDGLPGFLKGWRELSPGAKEQMFRGETKALGDALEIKARVGGTLEPYLKVAGEDSKLDLTKGLRPGNAVAAAIGYFVGMPHLIASAIGAEATSRLLTSKWYAGWLKNFPIEKGLGPEVARQMRKLVAYSNESLGVNQEVASQLLSTLPAALSSPAHAGGPVGDAAPRPETESMPVLFSGEAAKGNGQVLEQAKRLEALGLSKDDIYAKTGAFKQGDGKWRVEIDDRKAKVDGEAIDRRIESSKGDATLKLGEFFQHPALYKLHPDARNIRVVFSDKDNPGVAGMDEKTGVITLNNDWRKSGWDADWDRTLIHEVQHWLQKKNGFDYGPAGRDNYSAALGEREAENVADRKDMTPAERRAAPPHKDPAYEGAEFGDRGALWTGRRNLGGPPPLATEPGTEPAMYAGRRAQDPPQFMPPGADKKPRFEIDDSKSRLSNGFMDALNAAAKDNKNSAPMRLDDVLTHPDLFRQYPELKDVKVHLVTPKNSAQAQKDIGGAEVGKAWFAPDSKEIYFDTSLNDTDKDETRRTLLHEIQHWVQEKEGFQYGSFKTKHNKRPGEIEAARTEKRMDLDAEQRSRITPEMQDTMKHSAMITPLWNYEEHALPSYRKGAPYGNALGRYMNIRARLTGNPVYEQYEKDR